MEHGLAERFAATWLRDWNNHDLDRILDHYDDDVRFTSPMVRHLGASPSGTLHGRAAVAAYFRAGLDVAEDLAFDLVAVLAGSGGLTVLYRNHRHQLCAETMLLTGVRIHTAHVHYQPAEEPA